VSTPTLLVTGASGHLGSRVLAHLIETHRLDPQRIAAVTRTPAKLEALAGRGVSVRAGSFDDPASLDRAFAGIDRLLLVSTDALDRPGRRLEQHLIAIDAATRAGVTRILYTSMPTAARSSLSLAKDHLGTEQALARSGVAYTVLGNNWYFENLFHSLPAALKSGHWYSSAADGRIGYISREDCARVAAALLSSDDALDTYYEVAGEAGLRTVDIASIVTEVTGKRLEVVHVTDAQLTQGLLAAGVPEPFANLFTEFDRATREGDLAATSDVVRRVTGRSPDALRDFIGANAQALVSAM
jgi:NAD(P)H dehydrogenase (quinone)